VTASERHISRPRGRLPDGAANPQVNGGIGGVDVQDVFHVLSTSPTAGRAARLLRLQDRLGDRDLIVLHALAALRWMTGHQLQRLVFATGSPHTQGLRTRRCLLRLHRLGLLARVERHVGGPRGGSTSYTYRLSGEGQRLVGTRPNRPSRVLGARDHALAVSEVAVTLHEAHRTGTLELVRFEAEPVCWRSFTIDGSRRYLRPDAFVILAVGEWERLWFIELDRGTQPASTICRKTHAYTAYTTTGQEQARWGVFPRVAFLTLDPPRRDALGRAISRALARPVADTPDTDALVTVAQLSDTIPILAGQDPNPNRSTP